MFLFMFVIHITILLLKVKHFLEEVSFSVHRIFYFSLLYHSKIQLILHFYKDIQLEFLEEEGITIHGDQLFSSKKGQEAK